MDPKHKKPSKEDVKHIVKTRNKEFRDKKLIKKN